MTVINTNTAATITANALTKNERAMSQTMERLSTGQRINSAADDAAGLAISSRMTSQINGLNMAVRNTNDAISMVQTADGALVEVTNMLQRMRELAVQASTGTLSATDNDALDTEFHALRQEINRVALNTEHNGSAVFASDGASATSLQVGANASQTIDVTFNNFQTLSSSTATGDGTDTTQANSKFGGTLLDTTGDNSGDADFGSLRLDSAALAKAAIYGLDDAIEAVNLERASYGAAINRLEYAADNLANVSQNTSASRSRILDADYASETTELARTQIIQQAGTAMLSQANQQAQSVLALLK
ncbi:MAG: flagellin FliC [Porticoccaceae bacterium]|nr:flagellin FliC [Porticoccaceae bacterium]